MKVKRSLFVTGLVLAVALLAVLSPLSALAISRSVSQRVMKSVVQILAADEGRGGKLTVKWSGSGTMISEDGLILTNCHVALPRAMEDDPQYDYDVLVIVMKPKANKPAQPTYLAEVVQYDPDLDLAVLRVTQTLDGEPVDPTELTLPYLLLGDSDELQVDDPLTIFGYSGLEDTAIVTTSVSISGFVEEAGIEGSAWVEIDPAVGGDASGGAAVNDAGELVGVPTGGAGEGEAGSINLLRPINLALALIKAAKRGLGPQPTPTPGPTELPTGKPSISRLIFAPAVDEASQPVTVVNSFPSGTERIYFLFDYKNFQDGIPWRAEALRNGNLEAEWPEANWNGGPSGAWWLSISNKPLKDGKYEFIFYYNDKKLGSASVEVGGEEEGLPSFSNILFSGGGAEGYFLPAGISEIKATFDYANMTSATKWSYIWYNQGTEIARGNGKSLTKASGTSSITLSNQGKELEGGTYRLELYIAGKLATTSDCVIQVKSEEEFFGPITFAEGVDKKDNPVKPGTSFKSGITKLYAFFDYQGMQDGWEWTRRWSIDGEIVVDSSDSWTSGESGNFWVNVYSDDGLPDGEYNLDLLVEGQLVQSATCTIGKSGKPTPKPTTTPVPDGVELYGRIMNADTGRGIPGAVFIVLKPGITVDEFQWTDEEVYTFAEADQRGNYELPDPLVRGESYSMIVAAKGYIPVAEDGVYIAEDADSPFQLDITLQKQ